LAYSNDPAPNPYAHIPSPLPNIDFPTPYWINKLADFIIIGCLDPDLAYGELLVPAAAKMLWTAATPGTKQLVEMATGASWICGTKQVMSQVQQGEEIAASDSGRFIYGLAKGLDIQAYYAFMLSTGAKGVIDYASFAQKFHRVCSGDNTQYHGVAPVGGWPVPGPDWLTGPSYSRPGGLLIGPALNVNPGDIAAFIAWCSFSDLEGSGGVITSMRLRNFQTDEVYDMDTVNNLFSTSNFAVVRWFTTEGRALSAFEVVLEVQCQESTTGRMVAVNGGCFKRSWSPTASDAPPYWNMKTMLKSHPA